MMNGFPFEQGSYNALTYAQAKQAFMKEHKDQYTKKLMERVNFFCPRPPLAFRSKMKKNKEDGTKSVVYYLELTEFKIEDADKINVSISDMEVKIGYFFECQMMSDANKHEKEKLLLIQYALVPHDADTV